MAEFKQKRQETIKELTEWFNGSINTETLRVDENKSEIKEYLQEEVLRKSVMNKFKGLDIWYSSKYVFEMLTQEQSNLSTILSSNGYHIMTMANIFARLYPNNPASPMFENCAYWLANILREKWYAEAKEVTQYVNEWLYTKSLKGGQDFKPSSWFIIHISNLGFDIHLDYSKFNYPKNMGVYQEALDNWNSSNLEFIDKLVNKLCDYHLEQAHYGSSDNNMDIQFAQDDWFVFAFEVLAWLSIREMKGLENPTQFSHPMMQMPLNQLKKTILPIPKDELFEQVIQKLK